VKASDVADLRAEVKFDYEGDLTMKVSLVGAQRIANN
jgi:hypothetical protein